MASDTASDQITAPIPTLLLVEGDVLVRMPLAEYLRECGYRVLEAANVAEAKTILGASIEVGLAFADTNQPDGENGFAFARWVRQHHSETHVLLTSHVADAAEKAGDLCEDGPTLSKPYHHGSVLRRIQTLLHARHRRSR